MAFDGKPVSVANGFDDSVTRILLRNHSATFAVRDAPGWMFVDGASMWAVNLIAGTLGKISP